MTRISGKVTAATSTAGVVTVISGILAPYLTPYGTAADVVGLYQAGVTAALTFGAGYLARHGFDVEAKAEAVYDAFEDVVHPVVDGLAE